MKQTCNVCFVSLHDRPCIFINSEPYCFRCAKQTVDKLERASVQEYEREMKIYEEKKAAFQKKHPEFGAEMPLLDWSDVLPAVFGWIIFPVIGTIIGVMGWQAIRRFFWNHEQNKLCAAFESNNPTPIPAKPVEFNLKLDESRFGEPAANNYRLQILLRDCYTCQNCEQQFMEKDLEIHHIKIQAKGGTHHRTNLVTLCISCHDREKWFGHRRMYPKTL